MIIGSVFLARPAFGQTDSGDSPEQEASATAVPAPDSVAVENVTDDSKIEKRITEILNASNWFSNIEVSSTHGFVVLSGTASTDEYANWGETIASRTEDVIGVKNELSIESVVSFRESMSIVGNSLSKLYQDFLLRLPFLVAGIGILIATWFASVAMKFLLARILDSRKRIRPSLKDLIKQLIAITVWIVGFLLATVVVFPGMTPAKALTVLGFGFGCNRFRFQRHF